MGGNQIFLKKQRRIHDKDVVVNGLKHQLSWKSTVQCEIMTSLNCLLSISIGNELRDSSIEVRWWKVESKHESGCILLDLVTGVEYRWLSFLVESNKIVPANSHRYVSEL